MREKKSPSGGRGNKNILTEKSATEKSTGVPETEGFSSLPIDVLEYIINLQNENKELKRTLTETEKLKEENSRLKKVEAQLRVILDNIPTGIWFTDETGKIIYGNQVGLSIWKGAKYVGIEEFNEYKAWWFDSGKEIMPDDWAVARAVTKGETSTNEKVIIKCFDGSFKTILNSAVPVYNDEGLLTNAVIVNQDITELTQNEEQLSYQTKLLNEILEHIPVGIWVVDKEGRKLIGNQMTKKIWSGMRYDVPEDLIKYKGWWADTGEMIRPDEWASIRALKGEASLNEEILIECFDGSRKTIINSAVPIFRNEGVIDGAIIVNVDISELKNKEEKLRHTLTELERSNKDLEQFAYVASHDLQEPLRMVSGYTQLLSKKYSGRLDPVADEYIKFAVEGAKRMYVLIKDLLKFSRVTTEAKVPVPTDLSSVLKELLTDMKLLLQEKSAEVTICQLPVLTTDPTQIRQVFQNLIENGLKFHGTENPVIEISVIHKNKEWLFSIKDNGIGIEEQYFERIFQPFQRLHARDRYPGNGIGLALCKKIIERHGGSIWLKSEPGKGCTFYFTLPQNSMPD